MTTDQDLIQQVVIGWRRIKSSSLRRNIGTHKIGNYLAQKPLCDVYFDGGCHGCPVMKATSRALCHHTPFDKARANVVDWAKGKVKKNYYLIDRQIEFMESLERLEGLRRITDNRMMKGPVLATDLMILLDMSPYKLSHWMRQLGYIVKVARSGDGCKIVYYDRPTRDQVGLEPAYECASCGRKHRVEKQPTMPFSLTCADCKGLMSLVGIDGEADITHRIAGDILVPRRRK